MPDPSAPPLRILLVEDDPADAALVKRAVASSPISSEVRHVGDGEEALAFLLRRSPFGDVPRPDLILLDLNMPRMDGRAFLREQQADPVLAAVPVVVMTTTARDRELEEVRRLGAETVVTKPADPKDFFAIVHAVEARWTASSRAAEIEAVYEGLPIGVALLDPDCRYVRINQRLAAMNGLSQAEHIGRSVEDILPAAFAASLRSAQSRLLAGEEMPGFEIAGAAPDGGAWLVTYRPLLDGRGRVRWILATVVDVSARQRAEQSLRETAERLRTGMRVAGFGTFEWIVPEDRHTLSPELYPILGLPEGAPMTIERFAGIVHDDDRNRVMTLAHDVLAPGSAGRATLEFRGVRPGGTVRWVRATWEAFFPDSEPGASATRMVGALRDITDRRLAADALREKEEHLRLAIQVARLGTFEHRPAEDRHVWSPELYDMCGVPQGEPITIDRVVALWHPEDRANALAKVERLVAPGGGDEITHEHRIVRPDGEIRWHQVRFRAFRPKGAPDGPAERIVGVAQDVTERRAAEAAALQAKLELMHAARLSQLGEMASVMAHEIKQPLGAASNFLQVARARAGDGPLAAIIERAQTEIGRTLDTIRTVRAFVAKRDVEPVANRLPPLLADAASLALVGMDARVVWEAPDDLPAVLADPAPFQQVIVNLVRNAAEAMTGTGETEIRISARLDPKTGMVEIAVADRGPGIDPDLMPRLFAAFATTKPDGTGLGLSTSRAIVQAHGGRLWADPPTPGRGAVFRLTIPADMEANHD